MGEEGNPLPGPLAPLHPCSPAPPPPCPLSPCLPFPGSPPPRFLASQLSSISDSAFRIPHSTFKWYPRTFVRALCLPLRPLPACACPHADGRLCVRTRPDLSLRLRRELSRTIAKNTFSCPSLRPLRLCVRTRPSLSLRLRRELSRTIAKIPKTSLLNSVLLCALGLPVRVRTQTGAFA